MENRFLSNITAASIASRPFLLRGTLSKDSILLLLYCAGQFPSLHSHSNLWAMVQDRAKRNHLVPELLRVLIQPVRFAIRPTPSHLFV